MHSPEKKQRSLLMLMLVQLCTGFSMGVIAPILGLYIRNLGLSLTQIGLIGTASMLGWFIWEPIMGFVADRFNKRVMLAGSLLITTILYCLYPLADSFLVFIVLEFAKTSVLSSYSIPVKVLAAELLPVQDRGRVYGRYMTVISFGGMISPLIGGYVSEMVGFSLPFYLSAGVGVLGVLGVFCIHYDEPVHELDAKVSDGIRNLLTGPVLAIFSVRGLYYFNSGFTGTFISIFLNESQFMASESQIGAFFTILRLSGAVSRSFIGDICDRVGNRPLISGSLAITALSYICLISWGGIIPMYIIGAVQGICQAAADTSMMLQLISVMSKERSGLIMGLYSEAENIGGLISTPSVGYLYQSLGGYFGVWLVTIALFFNAGYSYLVIREKNR
jgi:predicted MFS family arabinose efflux permease